MVGGLYNMIYYVGVVVVSVVVGFIYDVGGWWVVVGLCVLVLLVVVGLSIVVGWW